MREARDFLRRRASPKRATTVRYRLAAALYELDRTAEALTAAGVAVQVYQCKVS